MTHIGIFLASWGRILFLRADDIRGRDPPISSAFYKVYSGGGAAIRRISAEYLAYIHNRDLKYGPWLSSIAYNLMIFSYKLLEVSIYCWPNIFVMSEYICKMRRGL